MKRIAGIIGLLLGMVLGAPTARACTCIVPPPPVEALSEAAAVFVGTASDLDKGAGHLKVRLHVDRVYKGPVDEQITVWTASNSAACGFHFEQGTRYLVYAHEYEGQLRASLCSRTQAVADAQADFRALGEGRPVGDAGTDLVGVGAAHTRSLCGGTTNAAALQSVLLVLVGLALGRRKGEGPFRERMAK